MDQARGSRKRKSTHRVRYHRNVLASLKDQEHEVQSRMEKESNVPVNINVITGEDASKNQQLPTNMTIRLWALKHNITRNALTELLKILISIGLTWLPSDARTLLETPQNNQLEDLANGKFWYNGIQTNLRRIFRTLSTNINILLNFNIDGIPLFNSAKHEFWPILANVHGMRNIA